MLLFLFVANFSFSAVNNSSDLQTQLAQKGKVMVIITLIDTSPKTLSLKSKKELISEIQNQLLASLSPSDFELRYQYQSIPCLAGVLTQSGLEKLLQNPQVEYIDLDQLFYPCLAQSVPLIRADSVHALGYTGQGCVVGVLDSGIDSLHPDLSDAIIAQWHSLNQGADTGYGAIDSLWHGTAVSAIIISNGIVSSVGVAPDAKIVAVKVLNPRGFFSDVTAGLDWIATNNDSLSVDVINMSIGTLDKFSSPCDATIPSVKLAIDALSSAGDNSFCSFGQRRLDHWDITASLLLQCSGGGGSL